MKPKARSRTNCLFCFRWCSEATSIIEGGEMLGAVGCEQLQKQLERVFILRQLLGISSTWCEEAVSRSEGDCNPELWFRICSECNQVVRDGWHVYQTLMELESRMKWIREKIKDIVERSAKTISKVGRNGIDNEIRRLVCPDIEFVDDGDEASSRTSPMSGDMTWDFDTALPMTVKVDVDDIEYKEEDDYYNDYSPSTPYQSRRRGGKKKNTSEKGTAKRKGERPRRRKRKLALDTYYKSKSGKYRRIEFHWNSCDQCIAKFKHSEELRAHLSVHEESKKLDGRFDCQQCSFPTLSEEELSAHTHIKHVFPTKFSRRFSCKKCDFTTDIWKYLKSHVEAAHPDIPEEEFGSELQLTCNICGKKYEQRLGLVMHQKMSHPEVFGEKEEIVACCRCKRRFTSKIRLQHHMQNTHFRINKFICDICGKGYTNADDLERHNLCHTKKQYVCHICGCDYIYKSVLDKHYKKYHPQQQADGSKEDKRMPDNNAGEVEDSSETFKCKYCDVTSNFKIVIMRHMQTHKTELGHQCDICDKSYTNSQGLKRHKRINHSETNELVNCPFCGKEYPSKEYMNTHLRKYCQVKKLSEQSNTSSQQAGVID